MTSGVLRPYTLTDVLGTLSSQGATASDTSVSGVGFMIEADETMPTSETVSLTVQANPGWGNGVWGSFTWT